MTFLYPVGFGLHHSGVEIMGVEYSFSSGSGIFESDPKEAAGAKFRESYHESLIIKLAIKYKYK